MSQKGNRSKTHFVLTLTFRTKRNGTKPNPCPPTTHSSKGCLYMFFCFDFVRSKKKNNNLFYSFSFVPWHCGDRIVPSAEFGKPPPFFFADFTPTYRFFLFICLILGYSLGSVATERFDPHILVSWRFFFSSIF
jgi:hypothetical protein